MLLIVLCAATTRERQSALGIMFSGPLFGGLPPGLFTTPLASSYPQGLHNSVPPARASQGQRMNHSTGNSHDESYQQSLNMSAQQFTMLQMVYQQQQVLQLQMTQLCLAVQQLQVTVAQVVESNNSANAAPTANGTGADFQASREYDSRGEKHDSMAHSHDQVTQQQHQVPNRTNIPSPITPVNETAHDEQDTSTRTPILQLSSEKLPFVPGGNANSIDEPPRRSPSKPSHNNSTATPTTNRKLEAPAPPQVSEHANVVLTWEPKRYSRSSSVGSSGSHHTAEAFSHNPLLGGRVINASARINSSQSVASSSAGDRSADPLCDVPSQRHSIAADSERVQPRIIDHHTVVSRSSPPVQTSLRTTSFAPVGGPLATRQPVPTSVRHSSHQFQQMSYQDVSLSDDGYISMDSAQYMQKFHLK